MVCGAGIPSLYETFDLSLKRLLKINYDFLSLLANLLDHQPHMFSIHLILLNREKWSKFEFAHLARQSFFKMYALQEGSKIFFVSTVSIRFCFYLSCLFYFFCFAGYRFFIWEVICRSLFFFS